MTNTRAGIVALIAACMIWGLSPFYYRLLSHIPPVEVLAHRGVWSLVFFSGILALQGRLGEVRAVLSNPRQTAVVVLTVGLGAPPWIALILAVTFGIYGAIKKRLPVGPVVSVTCEVLVFLPFALLVLGWQHAGGHGAFGPSLRDNLLLMVSGPLTAAPLILFSYAARRVDMSTVGVLSYLNPTLQFLAAALVFGEPLTRWHWIAFPAIWCALALYSVALWRQTSAPSAISAEAGVSTTVRKPSSDASAKP